MSIFTYGRPVWMISGSKSCLTSDVVSFGDEGARVGTTGKTNSDAYFDAAILTNPTGPGALNIFLEGVSSLNKTQMDGIYINVDCIS